MLHRISKMLMNEVDSSPGGGAPAPDADGASADKPADTGTAQAKGPEPLTIDALKAVLGDFKNSVLAEARRVSEGIAKSKGKSGAKPAEPVDEPAQPVAKTDPDLRAFDRATRRLDLSDRQLERMEAAFRADAPSDVSEWVAAYVEDLGIGKKEPEVQDRKNDNQQAAGQGMPKPPPSAAPSAAVTADRPQDVSKWDRQQIAAFIQRKGGNANDFGDPRNAAIWGELAGMFRAVSATKRIVSDPKR